MIAGQGRMQARRILLTGAFSPSDLDQMLRAQLVNGGDEKPCSFHSGGRPEAICPLERRGRTGDPLVPCAMVQQVMRRSPNAREPPTQPVGKLLRVLGNADVGACETLHPIAQEMLTCLLGPGRSDAADAATGDEGAEEAIQQVRPLLAEGRLDWMEFTDLLELGIYVMDPAWLPCRDDHQRDQVQIDEPDDEELDDDQPALHRRCCPLQVKAARGDRTVACAEAQVLHRQEAADESADSALARRRIRSAGSGCALASFWARSSPPACLPTCSG